MTKSIRALKRRAQSIPSILQNLLLSLCIFHLIFPTHLFAESKFLSPHAGTQIEVEDLEQQLLKLAENREAAIGITRERALVDPYWQLDQGIEITNKKSQKTTDYSFDKPNLDFPDAPPMYDLDEVELEFSENTVWLHLSSVDGRSLENKYTHYFGWGGIQDVIKDKQHVHILLRNGSIYSIFMVHQHLFKGNSRAKGGRLQVQFVGSVSPTLIDTEKHLIDSNLKLEFFDARKIKSYAKSISLAEQQRLRYGDLLVTKGSKVQDLVSYTSITDAMSTHVTWTAQNLLALTDPNPLEVEGTIEHNLDKARATETGRNVVRHLTRGRPPLEAFAQIRGTSRNLGLTAQPWEDAPWEDRRLGSSWLTEAQGFANHAQTLANKLAARSTYNRDVAVPPHEAVKLLEEQVAEFVEKAAAERKIPNAWRKAVSKITSLAKYFGGRALLGGAPVVGSGAARAAWQNDISSGNIAEQSHVVAQAIFNQMISILPDAWVFFETDFKVKLYDLGFIEGPEVWYLAKFIGIALLMGSVLAAAPKFIFAKFDKPVLHREVDKRGFTEGSIAGLTVIFSVALRVTARFLKSTKSLLFGLFKKGELLEGIRMGVLPTQFNAQGGNEDSNALDIQERLHQASLIAMRTSMQMMFARLKGRGLIDSEKTIDEVKAKLGKDAFKRLIRRVALLNSRITSFVEEKIASNRAPLSPEEIIALENRIVKHPEHIATLNRVLERLSLRERAELKDSAKKRQQLNVYMRWAGQDEFYYRYRHGEVPRNVISEALGWNSFIDMITLYPCAALTPFSSLNNPVMLAAGDQSFLGVGSAKVFVEFAHNAANWAQNTPMEVWLWARDQAGHISDTYVNPQQNPASSRIREVLVKSRPSTINETASLYNRGYWGLNLLLGAQKTGERFTADLRGAKIVFLIGTFLSSLAYMVDMDWASTGLTQYSSAWQTIKDVMIASFNLGWDSFARIGASLALAAPVIRPLWMNHTLGIRNSTGRIEQNQGKMTGLLSDLTTLSAMLVFLFEKKSDFVGTEREGQYTNLEKQYAEQLSDQLIAIENFYFQHDEAWPDELKVRSRNLSPVELVEIAQKALQAGFDRPATPMQPHATHKFASVVGVGVTTTVLFLAVVSYTWSLAGDMDPLDFIVFVASAFGVGRAVEIAARQARGHFGFKPALRTLRAAIDNPLNEQYSSAREQSYEAIRTMLQLYEHYEKNVPPQVIDVDQLHPDNPEILEMARGLYAYVIAHPPESLSRSGSGAVKKEIEKQKSDPPDAHCLDLISNAS